MQVIYVKCCVNCSKFSCKLLGNTSLDDLEVLDWHHSSHLVDGHAWDAAAQVDFSDVGDLGTVSMWILFDQRCTKDHNTSLVVHHTCANWVVCMFNTLANDQVFAWLVILDGPILVEHLSL